MSMPHAKGFTLIELLVVIAIIGLLSSIVLASLATARSKGRDAHRVEQMHQMANAFELYHSAHGAYPNAGQPTCPGNPDGWCRDSNNRPNWIPGLNEIMPAEPLNPTPYGAPGWVYHYYSPSANQYWLMTALENATPQTCAGGTTYYWFDGGNACTQMGWPANLYVISMQ